MWTTWTLFFPLASADEMRDGINPSLGFVRLKPCRGDLFQIDATVPRNRKLRLEAQPESEPNRSTLPRVSQSLSVAPPIRWAPPSTPYEVSFSVSDKGIRYAVWTTWTLFFPLASGREMRDGINPSLGFVRLKRR